MITYLIDRLYPFRVFVLVFTLLLVGARPTVGQNLATWSFGVSGVGANPVAANVTASNAVFTNPETTTSLSGSRFRSNEWSNNAVSTSRYVEVRITPAPSYNITVSQFTINLLTNSGGGAVPNYQIRTSADNFATSLQSGVVPTSATLFSTAVSGITASTATFIVRVYFWGLQTPNSLISIGSVAINGTVQQPALPVSLIRFQGKAIGNVVQLTWATAWEQNTDKYVVERSLNAIDFTDAGTLRAAGAADEQRTYTLTDDAPADGVNYYRLKQIDLNQAYTYSKLIAVQVGAGQPSVRVYPNPSDGQQIRLQVRGLTAPTASVHALTGQVLTGTWLRQTDTEATWQPTLPLPAGTYLLTVQDGAIRQAIKVLVW